MLKIAIQKSGRLSEKSLKLLEECGIKFLSTNGTLTSVALNFPVELLFLRDDDIPQYVEQQVADIGFLGENGVLESDKDIAVIEKLGFAGCRLSLAIPKEVEYKGLEYFNNKKIATSYPVILSQFLKANGLNAQIEVISGSVEIAPSIGLADAICDIVSSGSTLMSNGLKEVETILKSQAVVVKNKQLSAEKEEILNRLLFRIRASKSAKANKYIVLNVAEQNIKAICDLLPGIKSPTIVPLAEKGWVSIHSVICEDDFWNRIDCLKAAGAEGILVMNIEKMID